MVTAKTLAQFCDRYLVLFSAVIVSAIVLLRYPVVGSIGLAVVILAGLYKTWPMTWLQGGRTFDPRCGPVIAITFSPDGQAVVSYHAGTNGIITHQLKTGGVIGISTGSAALGSTIAISPDGQLRGDCDAKSVRLWNVSTGKLLRTIRGHRRKVNTVMFSPDGQTLASGSDDGTVKVWRLE